MLNDNTTAIVLAAGQGTRMKSSHPKVLHEILDASNRMDNRLAVDYVQSGSQAALGNEKKEARTNIRSV